MTLILGIETSCDETSVAVVKDGKEILSNIISSQIPLHKEYGGVVPELAAREHVMSVNPILEEALAQAGIGFADIDAVASTYGPGLQGALLVGAVTAKTIACCLNKPFIGVNHLEGHIYANFLSYPDLTPPILVLLISGGHTNLILMKEHGTYEIIGETVDDAIGECFDKVGRLLNLPYPGGPNIDKIAKTGNKSMFTFPLAMLDRANFSFSGVKTAVLYKIRDLKKEGIEEIPVADLAASFQEAVIDTVITKTLKAAKELNLKKLSVCGGVAANSRLREKMKEATQSKGIDLFIPPIILCTDNGAMIACAAYHRFVKGHISDLCLKVSANVPL